MSDSRKVVYVLGAGVDKPLGLPLANELLSDVADFAKGTGKVVADAVRTHLPYLRFSFEKYTGEQGENFAERILSEEPVSLTNVKSILDRFLDEHQEEDSDHIQAIQTVVGALEEIRDRNKLEDSTLSLLSEISGEPHHASGGDFIFNPRGIALMPVVRQAFRNTFQGLLQSGDLTDDEKDTLTEMALAMMNFEELLGELFSGFYTARKSYQKQYLYVAWLCWAYLRLKMEEATATQENGFYGHLANLPQNHNVITLNYTASFFPEEVRARVHFFHGSCLSYIRLDTRDLLKDENLLESTTPESIADFVASLDMDVEAGRVFLPGIVPPLSVKPVICREHLETWYQCGKVIDDASLIIIVGYSFNLADEHLNDLFRKRRGASDAKIIVINPDMDGTASNLCKIIGQDKEQLSNVTRHGLECKQAGSLLFVRATTEQLTPAFLEELLN